MSSPTDYIKKAYNDEGSSRQNTKYSALSNDLNQFHLIFYNLVNKNVKSSR